MSNLPQVLKKGMAQIEKKRKMQKQFEKEREEMQKKNEN